MNTMSPMGLISPSCNLCIFVDNRIKASAREPFSAHCCCLPAYLVQLQQSRHCTVHQLEVHLRLDFAAADKPAEAAGKLLIVGGLSVLQAVVAVPHLHAEHPVLFSLYSFALFQEYAASQWMPGLS